MSKVEAVQAAKARIKLADTEERNRLLYVALTRARDRLYVAGFEGAQRPPADCWYRLIREGLAGRLQEAADADGRTIWRHTSEQIAPPAAGTARAAATKDARPLPMWALSRAPLEPILVQPLVPSRLAPLEAISAPEEPERQRFKKGRRHAEPPVLPPAQLADDSRFLRGNLTHALLEHLPQVPPRGWGAAAEAFLARHGTRLTAEVRRDIARETLAILQDPVLGALFGPNSRAEVPIAAELPPPNGKGPALRLTGKIDRLVVTDGTVLILDYKTNRPSPVDEQSVPEAYLFQLAAYRLGIAQIFPGKTVEAAILWTDGLRYMRLPQERLGAFERRLWLEAPDGPG
jgi:ATP-dependent helicase/nuclease subunit A